MELYDFRCRDCAKLLMRAVLVDGKVEIKCRRCHTINTFEGKDSGILVCLKENCPNRVSLTPQREPAL